jgi:hypothetical protein
MASGKADSREAEYLCLSGSQIAICIKPDLCSGIRENSVVGKSEFSRNPLRCNPPVAVTPLIVFTCSTGFNHRGILLGIGAGNGIQIAGEGRIVRSRNTNVE